MAVPVRPRGLDDDNRGGVNARSEEEEGLEALDPEDANAPSYLRDIDDALELEDFDAFRQALDKVPGGVNEQLHHGCTALHLACMYGLLSFVQLLLRRGAELDIKDGDGCIPLHYASDRGFKQIVVLLLIKASHRGQVKGMVDSADRAGNTPLHLAARDKNFQNFRLLLAYGASPTKINSKGKTPVEMVDDPDVRRQLEVEIAAVAGR